MCLGIEYVKTALITGAAGGIGQALCQVFKEANHFVIGLDVVSAAASCDVMIVGNLQKMCSDPAYCSEIVEQVRSHLQSRGLTTLINNAAVQILKPTNQLTVEDWHQTLDVNLVAPFVLTQALLPELEQAVGSVVNIASIHASLTKPGFVCYATSKAALVGLTKSMAVDLNQKVRVNAICPAAVATPMLMAGFEGKKEEFEKLSQMHPLGRIAEPAEVAKVALFLSLPEASFISGATLSVDGGIGGRLHDPL
ncbi:MAG: SDR family oxidoreductase [Moorea sp. SIO4G3]|nr:SDR family oxidoreductase [Moorena sp. SIO4G3]